MRVYDRNDIAKIKDMPDNVENVFPCDKGEWVQFLMEFVDNPDFLIVGTDNSYLVAHNNIMRPLSNEVWILYFHSRRDSTETIMEIRAAVNNFARRCGTTHIRYISDRPFEHYGGRKLGIYGGWDI
jgi:hypothetical protein